MALSCVSYRTADRSRNSDSGRRGETRDLLGPGVPARVAPQALAARHIQECRTVAVKMLGNEREAEDAVVMGTRAAWWEYKTRGRAEMDLPWLLRHVIVACVMLQPDASEDDERAGDRPAGWGAVADGADALDVGLAALPTEVRAAVILQDVVGLSLAQTANALVVNPESVSAWLRHGRTFLHDHLNAAGAPGRIKQRVPSDASSNSPILPFSIPSNSKEVSSEL